MRSTTYREDDGTHTQVPGVDWPHGQPRWGGAADADIDPRPLTGHPVGAVDRTGSHSGAAFPPSTAPARPR